jgi:hypothetical protein
MCECPSLLPSLLLLAPSIAAAKLITATPANYTSFVSSLQPADTLSLNAGSEITHDLTLPKSTQPQ